MNKKKKKKACGEMSHDIRVYGIAGLLTS
jgi:hypothetical protein